MKYRLADTVFCIDTVYPATHRLLRDYLCEGNAAYHISTTQEDIDAERALAGENFSDGYFETLAVHRQVSHLLIEQDTLLFHGACLCMDGAGYLFAAPSGTGKSTHARLWRERYGDRVTMVNDDKPFLKIGETVVTAFGSPWDGKHRLSRNISVPLKAIALLERGEENRIWKLEATEAVAALLRQSYREADVGRIFPLVLKLASQLPIYRLRCNMALDAAEIAYEGMK